MQQLARRIENGHWHLRNDEAALALAASSKDLQVERHANVGRDYHARYGAMYEQRKDMPPKLPKVLVEWLESYRTGIDGAQTRQVGFCCG